MAGELTKEETLMQRDISCNSNKIEELKNEFRLRDPAKQTLGFISDVKIEMAIFKEELKNIAEENMKQHREILERIKRIEGFIIGLLVLFALSAVYFIFTKVGLRIP
jgi:hypothetical protein